MLSPIRLPLLSLGVLALWLTAGCAGHTVVKGGPHLPGRFPLGAAKGETQRPNIDLEKRALSGLLIGRKRLQLGKMLKDQQLRQNEELMDYFFLETSYQWGDVLPKALLLFNSRTVRLKGKYRAL